MRELMRAENSNATCPIMRWTATQAEHTLNAMHTATTASKLPPLDEAAFVARLGSTVEHAPWVARAAWQRRPFADADAVFEAMRAAILAADRATQHALLCGHPELAGREAVAGEQREVFGAALETGQRLVELRGGDQPPAAGRLRQVAERGLARQRLASPAAHSGRRSMARWIIIVPGAWVKSAIARSKLGVIAPVNVAKAEGEVPAITALFAVIFLPSISSIPVADPAERVIRPTGALHSTTPPRARIAATKARVKPGDVALVQGAGPIGLVTALGFNVWQNVRVFGRDLQGAIEFVASDIMLPVGGLLIALFAGYVLSRNITRGELSHLTDGGYKAWRFLICIIAPVLVLIVLAAKLLG